MSLSASALLTLNFTTQVHDGFQLGRNVVVLVFVLDNDSCKVVAASRQAFAFSRDAVLPFSSILSRVNKYTRTPVNAVWFVIITAGLLGLLSFAGTQAINAIFSVTVNALYIAYIIPIASRWLGDNNFKPGPFCLGPLVSRSFSCSWEADLPNTDAEPSDIGDCSTVHDIHERGLPVPCHSQHDCDRYELHRRRPWRCLHIVYSVVLLPCVRGRTLVYWPCTEHQCR